MCVAIPVDNGHNEAVELANAFPAATLVAAHTNGWTHFTESGQDLAKAFEIFGIGDRLCVPVPGQALSLRI